MIGVYLLPQGMGGSQLDYGAVDAGMDPVQAVDQGR